MTKSEIVKEWTTVNCKWLPTDKQVAHLLAWLDHVEPVVHVACQSGAVIREDGE